MGQADRDPMTRRSEQAGYVSQINELSMESELGKQMGQAKGNQPSGSRKREQIGKLDEQDMLIDQKE